MNIVIDLFHIEQWDKYGYGVFRFGTDGDNRFDAVGRIRFLFLEEFHHDRAGFFRFGPMVVMM